VELELVLPGEVLCLELVTPSKRRQKTVSITAADVDATLAKGRAWLAKQAPKTKLKLPPYLRVVK